MPFTAEITEDRIPALSSVAMEALDALREEDATNEHLERIIRRDPGLTSRVLLIANAPFYAGRMQSRTISDAVRRLGLRQLNNVIVAAAAGLLFDKGDRMAGILWGHSLQTAQIAQLLAEELALPDCQDAYVAGLLHDIGAIILYHQCPELFHPSSERSTTLWSRMAGFEMCEDAVLEHGAIGGLVVRKWRLPAVIAETARFHHEIDEALPDILEHVNLLCLVAFSDQLSQALMGGIELPTWLETRQHTPFWKHLQLSPARVEAFVAGIREQTVSTAA